jgi:fatty-acyl-CoA synthase
MSDCESPSYRTLTPVDFLKRTAHTFPDREGVVYGTTRYTYGQFQNRVIRLANGLKAIGISRGDRVAFMSPNTPPLLEAHFGVPWIGAVLVTINIRLSANEIAYIVRHSGARALFVDGEYMPIIERVLPNLPGVRTIVTIADTVTVSTARYMDYETFLDQSSDVEPEIAVEDENEMLSVNYTSGTTGQAKGVVYSHRGAYLNSLGCCLEAGMNSDSVHLWVVPMFHCNGWCFTWAVTAVGARHVCLRKVEPATIAKLMQDEHVTHVGGTATVFLMVTQYMIEHGMRFIEGTNIWLGGAPPSPTLIDRVESLGGVVTHSYGLTETYGPFTICEWHSDWDELPGEERARLKARQGVPCIASHAMRVVDQAGSDVPPDGISLGEIVMRGNNVMQGYYADPDMTADAFRGGWFHSGDLAVVHPDGYVQIKDRSKDIVISGGENISTLEVENVIYQHPAVLEVAVIGTPDEKWGEVPKAIVNLKPGSTLSGNEVIAFCRERLAHYKVPRYVQFRELPHTSTGKIMKQALRKEEQASRDQ